VYNQLGIELNKPDEKTTGGPDPYRQTLPPDFRGMLGAKKERAAIINVFILLVMIELFLNRL